MSALDRLAVGTTARRTTALSSSLLTSFVALSGDTSPIHVDDEVARARGFRRRVVHGLLLSALVSGVIGTELPGPAGTLQRFQIAFHHPCYEDDEVTVTVSVEEQHPSVEAVTCKFDVRNASGVLLAKGQFRSGVGLPA